MIASQKWKLYRGVAQLVARVVWDHEAAGSSPVTSTSVTLDPIRFGFSVIFVFNCSAISLASCLQDESGRKPRSRAWPFLLPCGLRLQRVFILSSHSGVASQTTDVFHVRSKKTTKNSLTNGNDSAIVTPINQLETCDRDEYFSGTVSKASCGWCEHGGTGEKEWTREGKPSARF